MPDIDNPFGEDDFDRIEAALAQSDKVERAIKRAQAVAGDPAQTVAREAA